MKDNITLIISHKSALNYWKARKTGMPVQTCSEEEVGDVLTRTRGSVHVGTIKGLLDAGNGLFEAPLDLLSNSRNDRRVTKLAHYHCLQGSYPEGSIIPVDEPALSEMDFELYVSSPEFTFVQMAQELQAWELIELGFELCGNYMSDSSSSRGYIEHEPVSTPEKLQSFANQAHGITGAKQARAAAKHIVSKSRSPEETRSCMLACLPRSLGGMGAKPALLNQSIKLPDAAARMLGTRYCTPDLYWPDARLAVEFDNRDFENDSIRAEYDKRKCNAYRMMGIDVVSITRGDLEDADLIRRRFSHVNKKSGKRLKEPNQKQQKNQEALLMWLKER